MFGRQMDACGHAVNGSCSHLSSEEFCAVSGCSVAEAWEKWGERVRAKPTQAHPQRVDWGVGDR